MKIIVVYDITEDEVRNQLREYLKDLGGTWLQYSVFELDLTPQQIEKMTETLKRILSKGTGDIRILKPCKQCYQKIKHITTRKRDLTQWKKPY